MVKSKKTNGFKKFFIKNRKWIFSISIISIITLPIILLSINWNQLSVLYATGSSAVFPLMKKLSQTYQLNRKNNKPIDITVESTGSGNGLEKILDKKTSFGNISYSPSLELVKKNELDWSQAKIKTISLGIDGICLVYKGDFDLDINVSNIIKIYSAFSGVETTYQDLGVANVDTKLIPFARSGGATKSGTTESFLKDNGFNFDKNNEEYKIAESKIKTGDYGINIVQTKESQAETWNQLISGGGYEGSISYLSTGFVLQNKQEIINKGFKIATYNGNEISTESIINGSYNWRRLLNTLVRLDNLNSDIKFWIDWLLLKNYNEPYVAKAYQDVGIIQLSQTQINSMKQGDNFWVDDLTLQPLDSAPNNYHYGAQL